MNFVLLWWATGHRPRKSLGLNALAMTYTDLTWKGVRVNVENSIWRQYLDEAPRQSNGAFLSFPRQGHGSIEPEMGD